MAEIKKSTQSIYIETDLWKEAKKEAGDADVSLIITKLLKMWLARQVQVILEPMSPADRLNREHYSDKFID